MIITSNSTLKPEVAFLLPVIITAGSISAVAIPNFIKATDKAKLKKSMMSMKMIGGAIDIYKSERNELPDAQNIKELEKILTPLFIKKFPEFDGWGNPFLYKYDKEKGKYFIGCSGKNGIFDSWSQSGKYKIRYSLDYFNDIILSDGEFIYSPED
jgi:type II secretory pathway pseudopilin PulG